MTKEQSAKKVEPNMHVISDLLPPEHELRHGASLVKRNISPALQLQGSLVEFSERQQGQDGQFVRL